ncbi:MAG TPA: sodium/solute symporter [Opitutaceae bacterium]|nr:sodium/solute symporter [Opitutaceae bacterium]
MTLRWIDWLAIGAYVLAIAGASLLLSRKPKSSEDYFLAGRSLRWPFIGASLFAANISAEHFVGLAGSGYSGGMAVGGYEWSAVFCLVPLITLFLPFYIRNKIFTVPEFLEQRYGTGIRLFFSGFMVILSVLTKISVSLWASSLVFSSLLGWNPTAVIWVVGLGTALYTMKGGLRIVVYTDALQTTILLIAAVILTAVGLRHVGGWGGLHEKLAPEMFSMVRPATDPDYPWPGMFFAVFLAGSFYWSMDQVLVQRAFAARDLNEGRKGAILCGFLKLTTPFLLVLPGLIAKAMFPHLAKADQAYGALLQHIMPAGLLGLTISGIGAALMGHISATYNSISTLFTRDFYLRWRPAASQAQQILVGRAAVLSVFVLGSAWAPMIGRFGNLFTYLQTIQVYLMLPFAGIFFAGVLWKRTTTQGVVACLCTAGPVCLVLMLNGTWHFLPFMEAPLLRPWLHSAMLAFAVSMVALVAVSLSTARTPDAKLATTTVSDWGALVAPGVGGGLRDYRLWLAVLLLTTAGFWFLMR